MYRERLYLVQPSLTSNGKFITTANDREHAKRQAREWFGNDPEKYFVTPLTNSGDRVKLNITLNV